MYKKTHILRNLLSLAARQLLPTGDDDRAIVRVEFHHATLASKLLAGYHGGTAAAEDIEHDFTISAAGLDAASAKGKRFRGGMVETFTLFC